MLGLRSVGVSLDRVVLTGQHGQGLKVPGTGVSSDLESTQILSLLFPAQSVPVSPNFILIVFKLCVYVSVLEYVIVCECRCFQTLE